MKTYITWIILVLILLLAAFLRFYQLPNVPPSLSWDEASVGYNAWSIANFGADEWGQKFPLTFKSFGEYKLPVHIYITAIFVKLFGLNELTTRLPAALFGVLNVLIIFFLAKKLFDRQVVGTIAAFVLAVSPYNIQFSRFNHELNFALFFFMVGMLLFLKALKQNRFWLPASAMAFSLSSISYNGAKLFIPLFLLCLVVIFFKQLMLLRKYLIISGVVVLFTAILIIRDVGLSGVNRFNQTSFRNDDIKSTWVYPKYHNGELGLLEIYSKQYLSHFQPSYLFETGEKNFRHSTQRTGEFYKFEAIFLLLGIGYMLARRSKISCIILAWFFLGPLPSSIAREAPHAGRAMFMTGAWHITISLGVLTLLTLFNKTLQRLNLTNRYWIALPVFIILLLYLTSLITHLNYYFSDYPKKFAIEWQYGMKQIVNFVEDRNGYSRVYMTSTRQQPYIYYLYYLKFPLNKYLKTSTLNTGADHEVNLISQFDKYNFGNWDIVRSGANPGVLYIVTPSEYDGMIGRDIFDIKKLVKYPDGKDAFYIVSYP